jgi:uncharacterized protein (TIGR03067 family)
MKITGKWIILQAELAGKQIAEDDFKDLILDMDETSYQLIKQTVIESGIVELVPDTLPLAISITGVYGPNRGKTFHCIYKFEGRDLIICYDLSGKGKPVSFETAQGTLLYLVRYRKKR